MFADKMKHEAIPERVFALCELVKRAPVDEKTARECFEPEALKGNTQGSTSYFSYVRDAASQHQLGLVDVSDKRISLAVDKSVVASLETMRKYIIKNIGRIKTGLFYETSQAYFDLDEKVYAFASVTDQELMSALQKNMTHRLDVDDMRAWRFWAAYLGFGHLARAVGSNQSQMNFLPNLYRYIQVAVEQSGLEHGREYRVDEFMNAIQPSCDIAMKGAVKSRHLNMAMSYGLRMMHDNGELVLRYQMDNKNLWYLYSSNMHIIQSPVSHITIGGSK